MAQLISKSVAGEPLTLRDRVWLWWAFTNPRRMKIGAAWAVPLQAVAAGLIYFAAYFGLKPLIGGWSFVVAVMVWLVMGSYWLR